MSFPPPDCRGRVLKSKGVSFVQITLASIFLLAEVALFAAISGNESAVTFSLLTMVLYRGGTKYAMYFLLIILAGFA